MIEKFKTYFETLEGLSTEELDRSAEKLVRAEKRNLALVIAHIAEMSRRKGHLERGYKNLFEYSTRRLNLSEGSVARRIQVANVSRRFSQILVALAENRMSLTVAGLFAPVLTESNVEKLLSDCAGMTKREAEEYLVALRPKPVFAPSIRKTPSPPALISPPAVLPTPPQPAAAGHDAAPRSPSVTEYSRAGKAGALQLPLRGRPKVQGEVRASGGSTRGREPSPAHGRDHGTSPGYRTRQERPEEKACSAA